MSAAKKLAKNPIEASAPCRIDSGGTWDIKTLALPLEKIAPVTVNLALNLRTSVRLSPFKNGWVRVSSEGFSKEEQYPSESLPFNTPFGLFFAAISYFGFHGLNVHISSDSPVKSALGGSSTALIALIKALSKLCILIGEKRRLTAKEILHLGYHLEDGVSSGKCGIQDQAAAVYGGVNRWIWRYGKGVDFFKREPLLNRIDQNRLSKRILVAFSGKSHVSLRINQMWINDFLSGKTRTGWVKVNSLVRRFGDALMKRDWSKAARLLREEMAVRREITPDALIPITEKLIDQAETLSCGARFAGAGAGGSVWTLGSVSKIQLLRKSWESTLGSSKNGKILECSIESKGVR